MKNNPNYFLTAALLLAASGTQAAETRLVNVNSLGTQGNGISRPGAISADGRYVVFESDADNLVADDTNATGDVFVRDRLTGKTTRVSVSSAGAQANGSSYAVGVSADGRFVVFGSSASNLVDRDTNGYTDAFVHDRVTGKTTRVSVDSLGRQGNYGGHPTAISANGRYVAFHSLSNTLVANDTNSKNDAFVYDRWSGETTRVSVDSFGTQGNMDSMSAAISANGRYVTVWSSASNLVAGDSNNAYDAFIHDLITGETALASVDSSGAQGNASSTPGAISANGRFIAFSSGASNLVFGDTNGTTDAFVRDRWNGETRRISVDSAGAEALGGYSSPTAISADGRFITFASTATNLVAGDTNAKEDAFVHDRITGKTSRISVSTAGAEGKGDSEPTAISADGRFVAFWSYAKNLVAGDTNGQRDAFVHDRLLDKSKNADLQTSISFQPASVQMGQIATYTLTITNNGQDSANNVTFIDTVYRGNVTGITASHGSCSTATVSVCRLGSLTAGMAATVTVNIKANGNSIQHQGSVNAGPQDSVPGNNAIKISTPVTP